MDALVLDGQGEIHKVQLGATITVFPDKAMVVVHAGLEGVPASGIGSGVGDNPYSEYIVDEVLVEEEVFMEFF